MASVGGFLEACGGSSTGGAATTAPTSDAAATGAPAAPAAKLEGPVNWLTSTPALADPEAIGTFEQATGVKIAAVPDGTTDEMLASFAKMTPDARQKVNIDTSKPSTLTFAEDFDRAKWNKTWDEVKAA